MNFPKELKYTKEHEWIKIDGDEATIGITEFAAKELGDIVFVEVESTGEHLKKNDVFGSIEAVKTVSDLFMPLSGEVVEFNEAIEQNPELINQDPYGEAWIVKVKLSQKEELTDLLNEKDYQNFVQ